MVLLGIAFGIAVVATLLLALHVGRRFPTMPAQIPLSIGIDGRPGPLYPRAFVWLVPAIFALAVAGVGAGALGSTTASADRPVLALLLLQLALIAYLLAWVVDRLIELGRRQTYRIAPGRIALVVAAIVAPIVLIVFIARLWSAGS